MSEIDVAVERSHVAIKAGTADIVVAIPTFNNEATVSNVLRAARTAVFQFPKWKSLIVHVDGGSTDSTVRRAKESLDGEGPFAQVSYPVYPVHQFDLSNHSLPGRDSAYRTIFSLAGELDAKVCCIVDCTAVVTPDRISALLQPVLEMEFDLAAPFYKRQKYDGVLVNGMLYPLTRALFGKRVRQPIGGDASYSRALIQKLLPLETWTTEAARRDVHLWLNIQALQHDMKLCQVRLGARPRTRDVAPDVSSILANLTGALYLEMEQTAELWQRVRGSTAVPMFGLRFDPEAAGNAPDTKPLVDAFRIGCQNLQDLWRFFLPPATLLELKRMGRQGDREFRFSRALWARVVYDFAVAFRLRPIGREHLLRALTPLYMGFVASYILSIEGADPDQVEQEIENVCMAYESEKPYLISRWRWPDRFMP